MPEDNAYQLKSLMFDLLQGRISYSDACGVIDNTISKYEKEIVDLKKNLNLIRKERNNGWC